MPLNVTLTPQLEQLRKDIRDGLNSGESTPWEIEEINRECCTSRDARKASTPGINAAHSQTTLQTNNK